MTEKYRNEIKGIATEMLYIASDLEDEYTSLSDALKAVEIAVIAKCLSGIESSLDAML